MEPKIKESEYFKAKISNRSSLEAVEDIKNRLSEAQKNIFRRSCFGHFFDVKELKFSAQLLHSILLREVKSDGNAIWFRIRRKNIRFLLEEFALVTGLDCSPSYEPNTENNDDDYRIVDEFLDEHCAITTKELRRKFLQAESDDDMKMVKMAMLYFVESVLLGNENKNHINETNALLVDNFTEFNEFPWGLISFKMTIDSLIKSDVERVVKPKKKSTVDSKYKGAMYNVHGFPHAFL
ncbi:hypothetical protein CISIN_1g037182mg, partial [Citrus sinensis]